MVQVDSLSLWERVGVRAQTATTTLPRASAAIRSEMLRSISSVEELTGARLDNGLRPDELFQACRTKPLPRPSPKGNNILDSSAVPFVSFRDS